ncbi:MAG: FMN-binding protein [Nevskia sp.]|nr:FMN-binding protein [Nevskia sp.]
MQHPFKRTSLAVPALLFGLGVGGRAYAIDDIYETQDAFLAETFGAAVPAPRFLDLDGTAQSQINAALGHNYQQARLRYWKGNGKTAWVIEDKGKEGYQLTTAAFAVKGGAIDIARVLIYRESHGEEVAQAAFLNKFTGAHAVGGKLDRSIDSISGATLSVLMMQRMAAAAIALDALTPP